jgi:dipeptide/tripeptide permease
LFAYTTCLAYLSPLLGALLADGSWGRYHTIRVFGVVYLVGLAILAASAGGGEYALATRRGGAFVGLFLVCVGTGGIKPCVSAFGADQVAFRDRAEAPVVARTDAAAVKPHEAGGLLWEAATHTAASDAGALADEMTAPGETKAEEVEQVRQFFAYFYFCINVGAVLSFVVVPFAREHYGFGPAFAFSFAFMSVAMLLFLWKRKEYVHHVPGADGSSLSTNFLLCWWLLRHSLWRQLWCRSWFPCLRPSATPPVPKRRERTSSTTTIRYHATPDPLDSAEGDQVDEVLELQLSDAAQAIHILPILAMFPIFWCLYDQQSSVWTLQATKMKLDWHLTPENMNAANPFEIMIFIPLFDQVIYPTLESWGWDISPLRRMSWGMVLAAASFSVSGFVESTIQYRADNGLEQISVLWQLPQITILAVAEIFVSVTGLEFAYATSPDRLKAFLMALFLLTTAVGDFLSGILYSTVFVGVERARVMHICALLMLGNLGLFCFVSRWWEGRDAQELRRSISLQGIEFHDRRIV